MGKLNINNGGVDTNKKMADIDERFGPYISTEAADAALGGQGRNTITAGLTVGILTANAGVKEYWYQPNKKSGILELIPKGGNAADNPTEGNFASFDENGNVVDSGNKATDFAPMEQAVPMGDTEDVGKILEKQANGFGWVEKPVDGKSALDIYNELNPNAPLDEAGFIAKLQQKYPMKYASYYETSVEQTIGIPFTGALDGEELIPISDTMGNLYIMPNNDPTPTGSIAFTTVNTGENTYAWVSLGAINIPDNALTEEMVDNECTNGATDEPASAKVVMDLKAKLEGVTASEEKVTNYTLQVGVLNANSKEFVGTAGAARYTVIPVGEAKRVRFLGVSYGDANTSYYYGFGFYNSSDEIFLAQAYEGRNDGGSNIVKEYVVDVPDGAVSLICSVILASNTLNELNFYCYLQSGESVGDSLNHIDGEIDRIDKKFLKFETYNHYQVKEDVFIQNNGEGRYVKRSTAYEIIIYDLNDIDTDLYFDQTNSSVSREATYVSDLDYTGWPTTSSDTTAVEILHYVGYQELKVGDKLEIPNGAKYVLIEHYVGSGSTPATTVRLLKPIDKFDDIYEDIDEINESLNEIEDKSKIYQSLKQYTSKTGFYIDANYKAHQSGNYKLIVFDIQDKETLYFKTERKSAATRYAVYVSEVDLSNLIKTTSGSTYNFNYKVGDQFYKDGDALSIPDVAKYVIVSYQFKSDLATFNPNPVYIAEIVERYDNIETRLVRLEENLPAYYKDYINSKIVEISDIFNSEITKFYNKNATPPTGSYKDGFMFYSDPHYPENYMMTGDVMAEIIKNTPIKKLINGGDIVCSYAGEILGYGNNTAGAIRRAIDLLEKDISPVVEVGAEYYQVRGNHDFSIEQKNNDDENNNETRFLLVKNVYSYIMSKNMRNPNVVIGNNTDDACCFYKDFVESKLRYIFLDLEDANNMYAHANNTMQRGYSDKQHKWFCQTLLSTPSDYNIVVISHQPVLVGVYAIDSSYTNEHYNIYNKVMEAMLAVNNKESYVFDNITYDFTDFAPKILMHQCGHTHSDRIAYNGVWENSIASAREGMHQGMEYFFNISVDNSLVEGTTNESLSDAIIIDNNLEGDINCVRLGPGCNRIIHQQEYELTNTLDLSNYSQLTNLEEAGTIEWYCFDSDNNSYDNDLYITLLGGEPTAGATFIDLKDTPTYKAPSVFRPWSIHASIDGNGLLSIGDTNNSNIDKIPNNYFYAKKIREIKEEDEPIRIEYQLVSIPAYKPNKNISGYVTVIAYSADLRIMEFFGVKVTAEG